MSFILVYDFPRTFHTARRQLNRKLHRIGAEKLQDSVWKCNDLQALIDVALFIKSFGGRAEILEEKFVF
ncbi:MAG: hypothetical protein J7K98_02765 [Candidatus Aenigmarchaeota archaeon]|nr:hypothetical protein [Candidatus Aenigmarchaeota archaeon]